MGNAQTMGYLISNVLTPFGLTTTQMAITCVCAVLFGSIGAMIVSIFLDKTKKYKITLIFLAVFGFVILSV